MRAMTRIGDFKDLHRGKRLFILGSGPSLNELDLSKLEHRLVMGLNRSFLAVPDTHYHCVMDRRLFDLYPEELEKARYLFTIPGSPRGIPIKLLGTEGFSWDLEEGIYSGYTIAYFALQVAVYMGFSEIFLMGLDLQLWKGNTHFFGFDFASRSHESTEFPKMRRMLGYAAKVLRDEPVEVYNCSPTSTLQVFPRVTFDFAISL